MDAVVAGVADGADDPGCELVLNVETIVFCVGELIIGGVRAEEVGCRSVDEGSLVRQVRDKVNRVGVDDRPGCAKGVFGGAGCGGEDGLDERRLEGYAEGTVESAAG